MFHSINAENNESKPDFILVGAPKSGTTFLLNTLRQNPAIFLPPTNEIYFHSKQNEFSGPYDSKASAKITRESAKYFEWFRHARTNQLVGEFATDYLYFFQNSIPSIQKFCGHNIKILIVLREQTIRTLSHYKHMVSKGHEKLSFQDAIKSEAIRKAMGWRWAYQYRPISMYSEQVEAYVKAFSLVKVLIYEEIKNDRKAALREIEDFLDVPKWEYGQLLTDTNIKNIYTKTWLKKVEKSLFKFDKNFSTSLSLEFSNRFSAQIALSEKDKKSLCLEFEEDVSKLELILGRKIQVWKNLSV